MRTCAKKKKFKFSLFNPVYQKPIRLNMALSKTVIVSCQLMVTILYIQFFAFG